MAKKKPELMTVREPRKSEMFTKLSVLADLENRSLNNYVVNVLLHHLSQKELLLKKYYKQK